MRSQSRDIPIAEPSLDGNEFLYVMECLKTGWVSSAGRFIPLFEDRFAQFCGTTHGVAVSNGTVALHLALAALGIGPGMEVIVPALTFIASANAVTYTGATPVFVDVDPITWTLDPSALAGAVTERTRAIIPVHLYGHPCEMGSILEIARSHRLLVIEDTAEAHGAVYQDRIVGSLGHVSCFSFYGNKIITTGEGGMCLTNDQALADRMRMLRDHGMTPGRRYWHDEIGFNYRMTNLQAALGVAQLERIEDILKRKHHIASMYRAQLQGIDGLVLPAEVAWARPVCWLYTILIEEERFGVDRDTVMTILKSQGIDTRPMFYPVHLLPPYQRSLRYPVAEQISRRGLSLPSSLSLTEEDIQTICQALIACSDR